MKIYETLDLLTPQPGAVLGNHGIWLPHLGVKVPFQWGGQITKRTRKEPAYSLDSIVDEVCVLRALAAQGMAPPVGDLVYFREVLSDYPGPGALWIDPCGAYGYEIADAQALPPGRFSLDAMRKLPIEGSPGAWNDILVKERGNVQNGYLIDVRRTAWDMLRWTGPRFDLPDLREPAAELRARVHRQCQFPAGERAEAYQDFWLRGQMERGQRRVIERAQALGFCPKAGETVLDIGCQSGSFLQHAWASSGGAGRFVGVEIEPAYVDCARALARSCSMNLCIRQMDVMKGREAFLSWVRALGPIDHLLLLSLEKHLPIFEFADALGARRTYIETNAVAKDSGQGPEPQGEMKLWPEVQKRGGVHVGNSRDRNFRRLYVIKK